MTVRPGIKYGALALAGVGTAAVIAVWSYREPIARDAIDDYLSARGVLASYDIRAIETRRQRLENIRIGDPKRPDLTADWAEIDVGPSLSGLTVKAVRAGGVRLHGRLVNGGLTLGVVDRLLPKPGGAPFRLPDIDLSLEDARMRLDTPYGQMGAKLDGQGDLRGGFEGTLALVAPRLSRAADCSATGVTAYGELSIIARRPTFQGPIRFADLNCSGLRGRQAALAMDASISEDGADWRGKAALDMAGAAFSGARATGTTANIAFEGDARKTDADVTLRLAELATADVRAARTVVSGRATLGKRGVVFKGRVRTARAALPAVVERGTARLRNVPAGLPVSPAARQLAEALSGLNRGIAARAALNAGYVDGVFTLSAGDISAASASGAGLVLAGQDALTVDERGVRLAGRARFGGGGFPAGTAELIGRGGLLRLQPYVSNGGRVALSPARFNVGPQGLSLDTRAVIDGPLADGRVSGLTVPLRLAPGRAALSGCLPISFRQAQVSTLRLGPTRFAACLSPDAVAVSAPRLRGSIGSAPLRLDAAAARYLIADGAFRLTNVSAAIGSGERQSLLQLGSVAGRSARRGLAGSFADGAGQIGTVPLRLSEASGPWSFEGGKLRLGGQGIVSDRAEERRFLPMQARDISVRLQGGVTNGTAALFEPESGARVADVTFTHNLTTGAGGADLAVDRLTFGRGLQPEAITPKTLGVVANVSGTLTGSGRIDWSGDAVTSSGRFRTDGLDFAAAFGPVQGLKGDIAFTDLLGLVTAPGQKVSLASVNPGVAVTDGAITYRLLPGYRVQVDGGRWPFAGGVLILEPTVLDMSSTAARYLTFRVEGLDAARFIAAMEFDNIAATGKFDGVLPMIFDDQGGRIEGGRLVAQGGGTLSYVGQVSNENLGTMGSFAFDALKSLKYDRLSIDLNGAVDGDVVTRISFAGVNQAPVAGGRTKLPIKVLGATNLPFVFNVTITAQFRDLFNMSRSMTDPTERVEEAIRKYRKRLEDERRATNPVQPPASVPQQ